MMILFLRKSSDLASVDRFSVSSIFSGIANVKHKEIDCLIKRRHFKYALIDQSGNQLFFLSKSFNSLNTHLANELNLNNLMAISHKNSVLIAHTQRCVMRASLEEINSIFSALINMRYNSTHDLLFSIIVFITHTNNTNKQRRLKKTEDQPRKKNCVSCCLFNNYFF